MKGVHLCAPELCATEFSTSEGVGADLASAVDGQVCLLILESAVLAWQVQPDAFVSFGALAGWLVGRCSLKRYWPDGRHLQLLPHVPSSTD